MMWGSSADSGMKFLSFPNGPDRPWVSLTLICSGNQGYFPGVELSGNDFNRSPPPRTEVKNEWSCIPTPSIRLYVITGIRLILLPKTQQLSHCFRFSLCLCVCVGGGSNGTVMNKEWTGGKKCGHGWSWPNWRATNLTFAPKGLGKSQYIT
jgi:hypothetical protein